jgi:hypothetical protein
MAHAPDTATRTMQAGLLAWVVPGAGHFFLGHRGLAWVFFAAITFPYVTGAALGGIKTSINPRDNQWLFLAELGVGSYTMVGWAASRALPDRPEYISYYPANDVAQIYLAVAGLLNLLAILDAVARAQSGGLPVFHHERQAGRQPPGPETPPGERA